MAIVQQFHPGRVGHAGRTQLAMTCSPSERSAAISRSTSQTAQEETSCTGFPFTLSEAARISLTALPLAGRKGTRGV